MPADIQPPSEADLKVSLMQCYKYYTKPDNARLYANDLEAILIRRCHAAEAECDRLRAELAEAVEALVPFAKYGQKLLTADKFKREGGYGESVNCSLILDIGHLWPGLATSDDCRRAAAFVAKHKGNA